jgi:uncharacterized protein YbaR (Trm112 family)
MTIEQLTKLMQCPESRQPLRLADAALVEILNLQIAAGGLKNRAGKTVSEGIEQGLVREDGKYLYPIRNNLPVLIIEEAIPLS